MEKRKPESTDSPRVSVITAFLDCEAFLAEAIESVIAQSFGNWELLLVDDGSGPAATAIAKSYAARYPGQIRYLEHPGHINRGISSSRLMAGARRIAASGKSGTQNRTNP